MAALAELQHIHLDSNDVAWIGGTRVKVLELVVDKLAHGSSPEEMHFQYPHLSLSQIHAALAYYYDHQSQIESEISRRYSTVETMREQAKDSPLQKRLHELARKP